MVESIWSWGLERPEFRKLQGDLKTDVLVIGGGMAGLLCTYLLQKAGVDCALAEAGRVCGGVTQNTTAKITCQHGAIYDKMVKRFGVSKAALYWKAQSLALEQYRSLCQEIDCDYKTQDSYVYSLYNREKMEREQKAIVKIGGEATLEKELPLPFDVAGGVRVPDQAQFHPLKLAWGLAPGLPIWENTRILELVPGGAVIDGGRIQAEKIIVATHFPFINKHGGYFLKLYQHRSYVIALKNAGNVKGMYVDENQKGLSFRNYGDLLLLGGGSHRTGKSGGCWQELRSFAQSYYPQAREVCHWATQDCMSLDDIPYIGPYSKGTSNLYVATGFHKWGMTGSMTAAMVLRDQILGKENPFSQVFCPSRSVLRPQLAMNGVESMLGLMTPRTPRCPHLGCALKYNPQEHSWDCGCHGSRFSQDGKLLNGPATGDKEI